MSTSDSSSDDQVSISGNAGIGTSSDQVNISGNAGIGTNITVFCETEQDRIEKLWRHVFGTPLNNFKSRYIYNVIMNSHSVSACVKSFPNE